MAQFKDIIQKVLGLDSSKEYDVTITEKAGSTVEQQKAEPPKPEVTSAVETPPATTVQNNQPTTADDTSQALKNALETIEKLKAANYELLTGKSVEQPNLTDEQIIANLCCPGLLKGDENGSK